MVTLTRKQSALSLSGFLVAVVIVAVVGAVAAGNASEMYQTLTLPSWAPPSWLFGPVWTILYLLIAVAGWQYWRSGGSRPGMWCYFIGLVLNAAWTPLFFAGSAFVAALVDIIALDVIVLLTIAYFRQKSTVAAWLLVPYLLWIGFATALTAAIVARN